MLMAALLKPMQISASWSMARTSAGNATNKSAFCSETAVSLRESLVSEHDRTKPVSPVPIWRMRKMSSATKNLPRHVRPAALRSELERQYGSIGIPAVAAAARYAGETRKPVPVAGTPQPHWLYDDASV
jgi:hypothetical protein